MRGRLIVLGCAAVVAASLVTPARAAGTELPDWVQPAVRSLAALDALDRASFRPNKPMARDDFRQLMETVFDGGYKRTEGSVTAGEVDAALVRALDRMELARSLSGLRSSDGWDPQVDKNFGTEIVARELGLRRDRPTTEESFEVSAGDQMTQADVVWSVWKAKTAPNTYGADALESFSLGELDDSVRPVVKFAFAQVGRPYIWGGEWAAETPAAYPFGAQPAGGFDCSGFSWFVLREKAAGWAPSQRPYDGWKLPERASRDMAKGTDEKLGYRKLQPGDLMFFAPDGREARAADVYHVGIYLGGGWMIDSSGSQAGVSLSEVGRGAWWHDQFAWGRRVVTEN